MRRTVLTALCCVLLLLGVVPISASAASEPDTNVTLNVYNWGEYIDPDVNDMFNFKYEDFTLENYNPHPHIKGIVAV